MVVGLPFLLLPTIASAEMLSVKGTSANFRDKPQESAKIKFSADRFYPVEVIEKKNGWAKVKDFEGDEAWVAERLLAKQATVVISADRANIRERPSTSSDVLFKVERGEVFKIEERKEHWIKIVDGRGDGGWIRDDMTWGEDEKLVAMADKHDKAEKSEAKPSEPTSSSKAKEAEPKSAASDKPKADVTVETKSHDKGETTRVEVTTPALKEPAISEAQTVEMLCRAYLDDAKPLANLKIPPSRSAGKPDKSEKPAAKPIKLDKKIAPAKPAAKPTQKKSDKKK